MEQICRCWYLVCLVFVLLVPACCQDDGGQFGIIRGVVKMDDGSAYAEATVVVKAGEKEIPLTCDKDGAFTCVAPSGQVTITAMGTTVTAKVMAGEMNAVEVIAKPVGVILTFTPPDNLPANMQVTGAYKAPEGDMDSLPATPMGKNRFWFRKVPATATKFAVVIRVPMARGGGYSPALRQQWTFDTRDTSRSLTMPAPVMTTVVLLVTDGAGVPIPNAPITGVLNGLEPQNAFWDAYELTAASRRQNMRLGGLTTDADGKVNLGEWPPAQYELLLRAGNGAGKSLPLAISADGKVSLEHYAIQQRQVTQTILDADGKPAPKAEVTASYIWNGAFVLQKAVADDKGIVVWKDAPPVRFIVWGDKTAAGVVPADAVTVTTPLPAPETNSQLNFRLVVDTPEAQPAPINGIITGGRQNNRFTLEPANGKLVARIYSLTSGMPFTLIGMNDAVPPRMVSLPLTYVPYQDYPADTPVFSTSMDGLQVELRLPLQDGAAVHGTFVTKKGTVPTSVSQLAAVPVDGKQAELLRKTGLLKITDRPDGSFDLLTPFPGAYRLQVDLFDESVPAEQSFIVQAKPGAQDTIITLPEPLLTVPGGTEVNWVSAAAPATPRKMTVVARLPMMPVYAPREHLMVVWYRDSPNTLKVWNLKERALKTLPLRLVYLSPQDAAGKPLNTFNLRLLPLMPTAKNNMGMMNPADTDRSESNATALTGGARTRVNLWAGAYLVEYNGRNGLAGMLDVPATGSLELPLKVEPMRGRTMDGVNYSLRLKLPAIEDAKRQAAPRYVLPEFDVPSMYRNPVFVGGNQTEVWVNVSSSAKTLSLNWMGVGYARDIALPPMTNRDVPVVTIPAWQPGVTVTGKLLSADGKPMATQQMIVSDNAQNLQSDYCLRVNTDANGAFTLPGLMPGALVIYAPNGANATWAVTVPEKGLTDLTLKVNPNPIRLYLQDMGSESAVIWWLPDGGHPVRFPVRYSEAASQDLQPGAGTLWAVDRMQGRAFCQRVTLNAGRNDPNRGESAGPTLGITFPLNPDLTMPGKVTLVGQGAWQGVEVDFPNFPWQPWGALGMVVGQLDAVPPGSWLVRVDTPKGRVETTVTVTATGAAAQLDYPAPVKVKDGVKP